MVGRAFRDETLCRIFA